MRRAVRGGPLGAAARGLLNADGRQAVDDYRDADVVVSTGGTYLVEIYKLDGRLLSFDLALAAGKPLALFTQSLGPFRDPRVRAALARIVPRAELVLLRDELSRTHLLDLGVGDANLRVVPDSVFALARPARLAPRPPREADAPPLRVAISVRKWTHFARHEKGEGMRRYVEAVRAAAVQLVEEHGASLTFLSTCQGIPEYWTDDSRAAREVVAGLPEHVRAAVTVDDRFHTPEALMDVLEGFDLVLATRMHMAIMSLSVGLPVLAVAYEFKTRELFQGLGLGRWVHDIDDVHGDVLARSADAIVAELPAVQSAAAAVVARERERALASGAELADAVRRRGA